MPAKAAVSEAPRASLYQIETEKAELVLFRGECTTDEERAAVDAQLQVYVGAEIRKVSGIAALLRHFKSQAAIAKEAEEHAKAWRVRWEGAYDRLKNTVHGVMLALDLPKVEGATDRFRRQKNPVALEITDAAAIPEQYLRAMIKMSMSNWKAIMARLSEETRAEVSSVVLVTSEVDTIALKAALQSGEVPGARLVQGEHLRVE